jgi:thiol-disulfide isomerase/thioredoxin
MVRAADAESRMADLAPIFTAEEQGDWAEFESQVLHVLCTDRRTLNEESTSSIQAGGNRAGLAIHSAAPDFALPLLSDEFLEGRPDTVTLRGLHGRYVLLTFWATWCGPCMKEYPELVQVQNALGPRGVTVIGILYGDSPRAALQWIQSREPDTYPSLVGNRAVARNFGITGLPLTVLVDPQGLVMDVFFGWAPGRGEELLQRLDRVLPAERSPAGSS